MSTRSKNSLRKMILQVCKLITYLKYGYRKIQSIGTQKNGIQILIFLSEHKNDYIINALSIDPIKFIRITLDPKIQQISQEKFYITAYHNTKDSLVYRSDKQNLTVPVSHYRPFWLLSNYYLGIELKNQTITVLAKTRTVRNIYLIAFIDFILLLGAWIIYRNVKKQMELSQLKSDFVSNVSHEIRTPLALINMYIETLEMGRIRSDEKVKRGVPV